MTAAVCPECGHKSKAKVALMNDKKGWCSNCEKLVNMDYWPGVTGL